MQGIFSPNAGFFNKMGCNTTFAQQKKRAGRLFGAGPKSLLK